MGQISIREFEHGDEPQITNLLASSLDDWTFRGNKAIEYWKWLYLDNPAGSNIIFIGIDDDQVIACCHQVFTKVKIGDEIIDSIYSTDTVVHPDYRRRGIYGQLVESTLEVQEKREIVFDYFFTENEFLKESMEKRYQYLPFEMKKHVRIKDVDIHMAKKPTSAAWIKTIGIKIIKKMNEYRLKTKLRKQSEYLQIKEINKFNHKYSSFWDLNSRYYSFTLIKNREHMNWRYADRRAGDYLIYSATRDDKIHGVLVGNIVEKNDYLEGNIVDLFTLNNDTTIAYQLIEQFLTTLDNNSINCIYSYVQQGHPFDQTLKELGFIDTKTRLPIFYNQVGADKLSNILNEPSEKYLIQLGDFFIV